MVKVSKLNKVKSIVLATIIVSITSSCAVNKKNSIAIVPELEGKEMVPINKIEPLNKIKQPKSEPSVLVE